MRAYLTVAALFFGAIAIIHVLRAALCWPFVLGSCDIPVGLSWFAAIFTGAMCVWAVRLLRS
jgi:hypothetical protein